MGFVSNPEKPTVASGDTETGNRPSTDSGVRRRATDALYVAPIAKPRFTEIEGPDALESSLMELSTTLDTLRTIVWKLLGEKIRESQPK